MPVSGQEILLIAAVLLLVFGAARLPKLARSVGEARREFRTGADDEEPLAP